MNSNTQMQDKQGHETTRPWNTLELVAPPVIRRTRAERASFPKSPHDSVNGKSINLVYHILFTLAISCLLNYKHSIYIYIYTYLVLSATSYTLFSHHPSLSHITHTPTHSHMRTLTRTIYIHILKEIHLQGEKAFKK